MAISRRPEGRATVPSPTRPVILVENWLYTKLIVGFWMVAVWNGVFLWGLETTAPTRTQRIAEVKYPGRRLWEVIRPATAGRLGCV
jgi:hypothetical protein